MSHRKALIVSLLVTTVFVVGLVSARDQLFASDSNDATGTAQTTLVITSTPDTSGGMQIIEITAPAQATSATDSRESFQEDDNDEDDNDHEENDDD